MVHLMSDGDNVLAGKNDVLQHQDYDAWWDLGLTCLNQARKRPSDRSARGPGRATQKESISWKRIPITIQGERDFAQDRSLDGSNQ
jgi:hypothetical protein